MPVPPVLRLPTTITGNENDFDESIPASKSKLRNRIIKPYKNENGSNKILGDIAAKVSDAIQLHLLQ